MSVIKFGITIITSRYLGADGRGIYVLVNQIVGFINSLSSLSVGEGLTYFTSRSKLFKNKVFFITIYFILIFSFLSGIILIFLNFILVENENLKSLNTNFKIIILSLIIPFTAEYLIIFVLRGFKLFNNLNKLSLISKSIIFIFLNFTIFVEENKIEKCLIFFTIAYAINCLIYLLYLNKVCVKKTIFEVKDKFKVIKYSFKVHIINFVNEVEYKIDTFIILFLLDIKSIGIYSIAVAVSQLVFYVTNSINTIIFPYLSSNLKSKYKRKIVLEMINSSFMFSILILLPLLLFGWFLFPFIFGEEFLYSYYVFTILSLATLSESISRVIVSWFKGLNKAKELINISLTCVFINIILNLILVPYLNLYGVAIASVISYWLRSILIIIKFKSYIEFDISQLISFDYKKIIYFKKIYLKVK